MAEIYVTKIGCEAYIVRNDQLLLGKRGNVFGKGSWALPGGHLEHLERADSCLIRELKEELGITVKPASLQFLALTDDLQPDSETHYIHITFQTDIGKQEPQLLEPDACTEWKWFNLQELPKNIFPPHAKILATIRSGNPYLAE